MIFSVIVPFFNEETYIEQCIKALLEQDFNQLEYELIFVDNASTDTSVEIVRRFPEVTLLYENKKGAYNARNRGLKEAKGEIVAFTDADCIVSKGWLTSIFRAMNSTDAAILIGRLCFPSDISPTLKMYENYENTKVEYVFKNCPKKYFFANNGNMAVKKIVFEQYGYFLPWLRGSDTEFLQRCISRQKDLKVAYLKEMKIIHLEIKNIYSWLNRILLYGRSNRMTEGLFNYAPLNLNIKLKIFKYCAKQNNYSYVQSLYFFFLLLLGNIVYVIGRVIGIIAINKNDIWLTCR
jgi:glycosyltransferase involved in cell wall biosynthesis